MTMRWARERWVYLIGALVLAIVVAELLRARAVERIRPASETDERILADPKDPPDEKSQTPTPKATDMPVTTPVGTGGAHTPCDPLDPMCGGL